MEIGRAGLHRRLQPHGRVFLAQLVLYHRESAHVYVSVVGETEPVDTVQRLQFPGGDECRAFVARMLRFYEQFCDRKQDALSGVALELAEQGAKAVK